MQTKIQLFIVLAVWFTGSAHAKAPNKWGRFVLGIETSRAFVIDKSHHGTTKDELNIYHANLKAGYEFHFTNQESMTLTLSYGHRDATFQGLANLSKIRQSPMYDAKARLDFNRYLQSAPDLRLYGGTGVGKQWVNSDVVNIDPTLENLDITYGILEVGLGYQFVDIVELSTSYGFGYSLTNIEGMSHSLNLGLNFLF
jgi:hypothetical protein